MPNPKDFKLLRQNTKTRICDSYVKDDIDLLQNIPEQISNNSILASFDVVSLYSNIPRAVKFWLEKYPTVLPEKNTPRIYTRITDIYFRKRLLYI